MAPAMTREDWSSVLRALLSLDGGDLIAAAPDATLGDVRQFEADPARFFRRADDATAAALWAAMADRTRVRLDGAPAQAFVVYRHAAE